MFLQQAKEVPGAIRFYLPDGEGGWEPVRWQRFHRDVVHMAGHLKSLGIKPGDRVAVIGNTGYQWGVAGLAAQSVRGVLVPVYPASTESQAGYVLEHSEACCAFVESGAIRELLAPMLERTVGRERVITMDGGGRPGDGRGSGWDSALESGRAHDEVHPGWFDQEVEGAPLSDLAALVYTSGTTGQPKGVMLSHLNVAVNGTDWLEVNEPALPEEVKIELLWLPMSHLFGWGAFNLGNQLGFTTYFTTPREVLSLLPTLRPTVFMSVPAYWEKLYLWAISAGDEPARQHEKLREVTGGRLIFCLSGGAGLKYEIKEFFLDAGILIIEGYGLTECSPTLTLNHKGAFRFDTVGKPLPSVELQLAPDGEILARGDNVFVGYYKDPRATREIFTEDGWLKTGDLGAFTEDGFLKIVGRKKEIIVTAGGKNIPPANIEGRFADDPYIEHLVVVGDRRKYLTALVTLRREAVMEALGLANGEERKLNENPKVRELIEQRIASANRSLARYETIKKFAIAPEPLTVENGLLTASLKVRRKKVLDSHAGQIEALYREGS